MFQEVSEKKCYVKAFFNGEQFANALCIILQVQASFCAQISTVGPLPSRKFSSCRALAVS